MKYCRKCGSQIVDYANFCNVCGEATVEVPQQEIIREEIVEIVEEKMESKAPDNIVVGIVLLTVAINMILVYVFSSIL